MVSFTLGKKTETGSEKKSGFGGFSVSQKKALTTKKPSKPFTSKADEVDDDENKIIDIDTFDTQSGAFNRFQGPVIPKGPLVIKNEGNANWRQVSRERFNPTVTKNNEPDSRKLEYGINFIDAKDSKKKNEIDVPLVQKAELDLLKDDIANRPDVATLEEYEEVPVEDFGAAMLRGMGWKGDDKGGKKDKVIPVVQRAQFLGLGAKSTTDGKPVTERIYNPVKRINKRTGQVEEESRSRERSPKRESQSYRSRS